MRNLLRILAALAIITSCSAHSGWTEWEKTVIDRSDSVMYVGIVV